MKPLQTAFGAVVVYLFTFASPVPAQESVGTGICTNTAGEAEPCRAYEPPTYSRPVYRPSPQEIERQRRAAEDAARARQATIFNDKGLRCEAAANYECALQYFQQALRYSPNDRTIRSNIASMRAFLAGKNGKLSEAIAYWEEALRFAPENKSTRGNLYFDEAWLEYNSGNTSGAIAKMQESLKNSVSSRAIEARHKTILGWQRELDNERRAEETKRAQEREEAVAKAAVQKHVTDLIGTLQGQRSRDAGPQPNSSENQLDFLKITPHRGAQNCPFDKCGTPDNPNLTAPNNGTPVDNANTAAQASSNSQTGKIATAAPIGEGASGLAQEGFDKKSTIRGVAPVLAPQITGMQHAAVDDWSELYKKTLSGMSKNDPRYAKLQGNLTELFDASVKLDAVTKELKAKGVTNQQDLQNDAKWNEAKSAVEDIKKKIVVVLDENDKPQTQDKPPKRIDEVPPPPNQQGAIKQ